MKKVFLLLLLCMLSTSVFADENKRIYQKEDIVCAFEGYNQCEDKNGHPITGILEVRRQGKLVLRIEYKNGLQDGKKVLYSSDGEHPALEFTIKNGKSEGISKSYYSDTHTIKSKSMWENGIMGKGIRYYKNGKKQFTTNNNKKSPQYTFFDKKEHLFATFDINGITCYNKNEKAKNTTTDKKILKIQAILEEMEVNQNKEYDFTFLCR